MRTIPIFFTFDNNYVEPAAVAFYSLLNKAKEDVFYEMFVLHSDIAEEKQQILSDIVNKKGNGKLTFINTKGFLDELWQNGSFNFQSSNSTFTADTIIRCFGARFFPQYDKIIYSDVDCVFVDDISELIDTNLEGKYIGAVKNAFMKFYSTELSHMKPEHYQKFKDTYFAGGIWVLNLKKIREDNLERKMIDIINDNTIIKRWNDMDIMNIACDNNVEYIPLNYIAYPYLLDEMQKKGFKSDFSREELYDSIINPKIIHYAAIKPWNNNPKYSEVWWTIFNYLKLKKTKIFREASSEIVKKYKKYKKLYLIFLIFSTFSMFFSISVILIGFLK